MKRKLQWTEDNPNFEAFETPDGFAGPPCAELQDAPACKGMKVDTPAAKGSANVGRDRKEPQG